MNSTTLGEAAIARWHGKATKQGPGTTPPGEPPDRRVHKATAPPARRYDPEEARKDEAHRRRQLIIDIADEAMAWEDDRGSPAPAEAIHLFIAKHKRQLHQPPADEPAAWEITRELDRIRERRTADARKVAEFARRRRAFQEESRRHLEQLQTAEFVDAVVEEVDRVRRLWRRSPSAPEIAGIMGRVREAKGYTGPDPAVSLIEDRLKQLAHSRMRIYREFQAMVECIDPEGKLYGFKAHQLIVLDPETGIPTPGTPPLILGGPHKPPIIWGVAMARPLSACPYAVLKAMLDAGCADGHRIGTAELAERSGYAFPARELRRMRKRPQLAALIDFPGVKGKGGYGFKVGMKGASPSKWPSKSAPKGTRPADLGLTMERP